LAKSPLGWLLLLVVLLILLTLLLLLLLWSSLPCLAGCCW